MAGSNDENDINEITNFNESAVMSSFEIHSTPNVGQDNKDRNINITDEINITNDSGIQLTPKLDSKNKKPNENINSETGAKSTPEVTNIKEKELSMNDIFNLIQTCLLYTSRCV